MLNITLMVFARLLRAEVEKEAAKVEKVVSGVWTDMDVISLFAVSGLATAHASVQIASFNISLQVLCWLFLEASALTVGTV